MMRPMNQNMNRMNQNVNRQNESGGRNGCGKDLKMLRAIDFAIQETVLYLDAYPENQQALDYYHELLEQRKQLLSSHEKNCGPMTMYGNVSRNSWDWVEGPWPWETDAN